MKNLHAVLILGVALATGCDSKPTGSPRPAGSSGPTVSRATSSTTQVSGASTEKQMRDGTVQHTEEEWKKILTPEQYHVLREKGTERAFTGKYDDFYQGGTYSCAACGQVLFSSKTKFDAGCGWPAFFAAEAGDRVKLTPDYSYGMVRTEVDCSRCGSHLGHLFNGETHVIDGKQQTVNRYCINSVSLKFTPASTTAPAEKK